MRTGIVFSPFFQVCFAVSVARLAQAGNHRLIPRDETARLLRGAEYDQLPQSRFIPSR
jgi:hypothetical protein